jgi:hypothetical protein
MPSIDYPQLPAPRTGLTREEKRRKQAIRNWKRQQKELVEYYNFARTCAGIRYVPALHASAPVEKTPKLKGETQGLSKNIQYTYRTLVDLFHTDDAYWKSLDESKMTAEKSALSCLE